MMRSPRARSDPHVAPSKWPVPVTSSKQRSPRYGDPALRSKRGDTQVLDVRPAVLIRAGRPALVVVTAATPAAARESASHRETTESERSPVFRVQPRFTLRPPWPILTARLRVQRFGEATGNLSQPGKRGPPVSEQVPASPRVQGRS
jgi:hypothetical protein